MKALNTQTTNTPDPGGEPMDRKAMSPDPKGHPKERLNEKGLNEKGLNKKRIKRGWRAVLILMLLAVLCYAALLGWVVYAETHLPEKQESQAILVLGAQVKEDGTLSISLHRRLSLARTEYFQHPQLIVTCGAQGADEPAPEGEVMRRWLIDQGVPEDQVLAETASFNTRENLLHAKAMMEERGLTKALIVTSDYHVARALSLCKQLGIEATGVGSHSEPDYWWINHTREGLSWIKFWLEGLL